MSERPTPETDAVFIWEPFLEVDVNKAQKLCEKLERERDEAREENARLRDIAEWAVDNIFHKCTEDLIRAELKELKQLK
jgi:hypothetical protein